MPKVKAGTLKPAIDAMRKRIQEKGDAAPGSERRGMRHHLKRLQRKARRIHREEERHAAAGAKAKASAGAGTEPAPE